jgi:hypothetical protein
MIASILQNPDLVFWACALFGTLLFLLRMLAAGFAHDDSSAHHDVASSDSGDGDGFDIEHNNDGDSDYHETSSTKSSLKLFTTHSISGFFMMFGWAGLACTQQLGYSNPIAMLIASVIGVMTMFCTALIFRGAKLLVSQGSHFDVKKTIGLVGTVYQRIPANGFGKIQLEVEGTTREVLAQSLNHCTIDSFKLVKVVQKLDHEAVIVTEVTQ